MDKAFMEQMKKKVEKELAEREVSVIAFWQEEIEKLLQKKSDSLSSLQVDLKNLTARMQNRVRTLKKSSEY